MNNPDITGSNAATPTRLEITAAENGGYVVEAAGKDPRIKSELIGAYSNAADLIEAMPEILGTDGLKVNVAVKINTGEPGLSELADALPPGFLGPYSIND